ncbi:IS3 family transposase [Virgibacillus ainsalahensis]
MPRYYDHEFKQYIAKLVVEEEKNAAEVAREMDVPYKTMSRWVSNYRKKQKAETADLDYITPSEHKKREKELLDRIKDLEEENEIIKKAASIFMKNQK